MDRLTPFSEVEKIRILYDVLLNDKQHTEVLRSDLVGEGVNNTTVEKITQITRSSIIESKLLESVVYTSTLDYAK